MGFTEKSFKLLKLFSVGERALPSAPRLEGHTFANARRIHPLRSQVCDKWGALCQKCDFGTRSKF